MEKPHGAVPESKTLRANGNDGSKEVGAQITKLLLNIERELQRQQTIAEEAEKALACSKAQMNVLREAMERVRALAVTVWIFRTSRCFVISLNSFGCKNG